MRLTRTLSALLIAVPAIVVAVSATPASAACVSNAMGIPPAGQAYVGSTSTAHGSPAVQRLFFGTSTPAKAQAAAKTAAAANRIPWISFTAPHSWPSMATGAGDTWAKNLAVALSTSGGPVWVAINHEPEGDGGDIQQWVKMQKRLGPIFHQYSNNVAFTQISSAWTNFEGPEKYSMDNLWAGNAAVDIVGSDAYNGYGAVKNGKTNMKWSEMTRYYDKLAPWAAAHKVKWAIGESAYTNSAATKDASWLTRSYTDMRSRGGLSYGYYDSLLHSKGSWSLATTAKQNQFKSILGQSARIC